MDMAVSLHNIRYIVLSFNERYFAVTGSTIKTQVLTQSDLERAREGDIYTS
jgi:hypothetical protein